jgi:hypothetical protein
MATHDYVIDNQTAPNFRADLNNALAAIVSQNSNATAPSVTYANMFWYDTANNLLRKRNEANSGWITLGTIDEGTGTFTPSGERALASQVQAEAGTDNTTLMTPLRTEQHMTANALGYGQTWQAVSRTSGVSYQNTTGKPIQVSIGANNTAVTFQVSTDNSSWVTLGTTGTNVPSIFFAVIPNGHYYRATGGVSTAAELR